ARAQRRDVDVKNQGLIARRKLANQFFLVLSIGAAGFGLVWLTMILYSLFYNGFSAINAKVFTEITPPPGEDGGLINAIVGSVLMSTLAVLGGTPIGMLAGTYLAEYGRYGRLAFFVRFVNDILLSAPSIVTGIFIYEILVAPLHGFSGWAGAVSLM